MILEFVCFFKKTIVIILWDINRCFYAQCVKAYNTMVKLFYKKKNLIRNIHFVFAIFFQAITICSSSLSVMLTFQHPVSSLLSHLTLFLDEYPVSHWLKIHARQCQNGFRPKHLFMVDLKRHIKDSPTLRRSYPALESEEVLQLLIVHWFVMNSSINSPQKTGHELPFKCFNIFFKASFQIQKQNVFISALTLLSLWQKNSLRVDLIHKKIDG